MTNDQLDEYRELLGLAFGTDPERYRTDERLSHTGTRTCYVHDDKEIVGAASAIDLGISVPGGSTTRCTGSTLIAVKPTHQRRGVFRAVMAAHLAEVVRAGHPFAALWSTDSALYDRYGYGIATREDTVTVPAGVSVHARAPTPAQVAVATVREMRRSLEAVYQAAMRTQPGLLTRNDSSWARLATAQGRDRRGDGPTMATVALDSKGESAGYCIYRIERKHSGLTAESTVHVAEFVTLCAEATIGLWQYLLGLPLVADLRIEREPCRSPALDVVDAPRLVNARSSDALWVRILNVPDALESRRYRIEGVLCLDIADSLGHTTGRYRLAVDATGEAKCERFDGPPDLSLDIQDLAAPLFGTPCLTRLASAGRVAGDFTDIEHADAVFGWRNPPRCLDIF